jgi:Druantia protein DruA
MYGGMGTILTYRGRPICTGEIDFIRNLIENNPDDHRTALSRRICKAWNWTQHNGQLKDMVCRGLLLRLEAEGYIALPAKQSAAGGRHSKTPEPLSVDQSPIQTEIGSLVPIDICQVRRTSFERLHDALLAQFHYLGYAQPVGEHLKYLAFVNGGPVACLAWSSAPRHIGCRDRYIGWSGQLRQKNLHLLAYNTRFLVLPWVVVPNLASHLLARCAAIISKDWQSVYAHPVFWLETFIDTSRFKGTCYQAAGWTHLGNTTGRGKNDQTHQANRSIKAVWGYPLSVDFREALQHG